MRSAFSARDMTAYTVSAYIHNVWGFSFLFPFFLRFFKDTICSFKIFRTGISSLFFFKKKKFRRTGKNGAAFSVRAPPFPMNHRLRITPTRQHARPRASVRVPAAPTKARGVCGGAGSMQHARGADQSRAERPGSRRVLGPSHEPDPSLLLMKYGLITRSRKKHL